jgi:N-acetylglucosamine-6-phosphate deacetylase
MLSQQVATSSNVDASRRLIKFKNCRILRDHKIIREDLWVRDGKIINPEKVFFDEQRQAHLVNLITHQSSSTCLMTSKSVFFLSQQIDCHNAIISSGFIDLQINGSFCQIFSILAP